MVRIMNTDDLERIAHLYKGVTSETKGVDYTWKQIEGMETPPWLEWHSATYFYDYARDDAMGIRVLTLTPKKTPDMTVFISDDCNRFITSSRNQLGMILSGAVSCTGSAYFVRRGAPRPARYFAFGLYAGRVTLWRAK